MKRLNFLSVLKTLFTFIFLFTVVTACSNSASSDDHGHEEAEGFRLYMGNETEPVVEQLPEQNLTGEIQLTMGDIPSQFSIYFISHDGDEFQPEDDEYTLGDEFNPPEIVEFQHVENDKWSFQLSEEVADTTNMTLFLNHGNHPDFTSQNIPIYVNEAD